MKAQKEKQPPWFAAFKQALQGAHYGSYGCVLPSRYSPAAQEQRGPFKQRKPVRIEHEMTLLGARRNAALELKCGLRQEIHAKVGVVLVEMTVMRRATLYFPTVLDRVRGWGQVLRAGSATVSTSGVWKAVGPALDRAHIIR